jgi:hypothetical protein
VPGKAKPARTHRGGDATTRRRGRLGTVAREAAGRVEMARGRGDEKIERRYPCKGCGGEATKGGLAVRMPHGTERAWALARPRPVHGAVLLREGARRGWLMRGPRLAVGEGGRSEALVARGPSWKKKAWAELEGTVTFRIYSNQFQTCSICFDQKVDLTSSKN